MASEPTFDEEALHEVRRIEHYRRHFGDPALAERPVGGTFAADNVEGFIRLLEGSGTIAVERRDEITVVLRAAR